MLNYFKQLSESFIKKIAMRLYRITEEGKYAQIIFSQEGEDITLKRLFLNQKNGFYVDVGAHHPFRFSNTFFLYKSGWRGINIDANPLSIQLFEKYRSDDINLNIGVSNIDENLTYHVYNEPALNTFSKDIVNKLKDNPQYHIIDKKEIMVKPLSTLLHTYLSMFTKIDLLNIDVEGFDLNVLKSNDWLYFRPSVIVIESQNVEIDNIKDCPIYKFLSMKNYKIISKISNSCIYIEKC